MFTNRNAPSYPMKSLCESWLKKIDTAIKHRDEVFGKYAAECEMFFDEKTGKSMWELARKSTAGPGGFLDSSATMPTFCVTVNKLFEAVTLYGPALYHQNPHVSIEAVLPPKIGPEALGINQADQMAMQQFQQLQMQEMAQHSVRKSCAAVKEHYINWLQQETDKKTVARECIQDAVVSGIGIGFTEMYAPPFSSIKLPRTRRIEWRDVVIDPDAKDWEGVEWIAVRFVQARNRVAAKFSLEEDDLVGTAQSYGAQSTSQGQKEARSGRKGQSFDLVEYWEVYSKNGLGERLANDASLSTHEPEFNFEQLGANCLIAVSHNIPYPLNLPPTVVLNGPSPEDPKAIEQFMQKLQTLAQWPIPYWYDSVHPRGGWPISILGFFNSTDGIWPMPLGKAAMGELRFVNWVFSFLADKVASSCTTYVAMAKSCQIELQPQVDGKPMPFVRISVPEALQKNLSELVAFLNAPQFSPDIWAMLAQVLELIDKRTGLTELVYGLTSRQIRSATEANVRDANMSVRPDDMASKVEDWMTELAVREMQASHWFCMPEDVAPAVGQMGAMVWQQHIMTQDVDQVVRGFNYTVAAGSARKPNKATKISQLQEFGQSGMQVFAQLALQGMPQPFNAFMQDLGEVMDLDPSRYMIELPPPPEEQGPTPEQIKLEAKMKEMEIKLAEMQAEFQFTEAKHNQELVHAAEKHELDMTAQEEKNKIAAEAARKAANKPKPVGAR